MAVTKTDKETALRLKMKALQREKQDLIRERERLMEQGRRFMDERRLRDAPIEDQPFYPHDDPKTPGQIPPNDMGIPDPERDQPIKEPPPLNYPWDEKA